MEPKASIKYRYFNHHHELTDSHEFITIDGEDFIANKAAIPLLKALNDVGLKTRSHHYDGGEHGFVTILLDNVEIEIKEVNEIHADRTTYNGKKELLIRWNTKQK